MITPPKRKTKQYIKIKIGFIDFSRFGWGGARGPGPPTLSRGVTINNLNNLNCV
jgi:hypothetical protein